MLWQRAYDVCESWLIFYQLTNVKGEQLLKTDLKASCTLWVTAQADAWAKKAGWYLPLKPSHWRKSCSSFPHNLLALCFAFRLPRVCGLCTVTRVADAQWHLTHTHVYAGAHTHATLYVHMSVCVQIQTHTTFLLLTIFLNIWSSQFVPGGDWVFLAKPPKRHQFQKTCKRSI